MSSKTRWAAARRKRHSGCLPAHHHRSGPRDCISVCRRASQVTGYIGACGNSWRGCTKVVSSRRWCMVMLGFAKCQPCGQAGPRLHRTTKTHETPRRPASDGSRQPGAACSRRLPSAQWIKRCWAWLRRSGSFVPQFALAGKVVVLDEVHSYDLYTGTLISHLVQRLRELTPLP